jgi:hypothetical protein
MGTLTRPPGEDMTTEFMAENSLHMALLSTVYYW